jgi:hypothetical protein
MKKYTLRLKKMFKITPCHLPRPTSIDYSIQKKTAHSKSLCLPVLFETKKKQSAGRVLSLTPPPPPPPPQQQQKQKQKQLPVISSKATGS